jgi:hypothetical protein
MVGMSKEGWLALALLACVGLGFFASRTSWESYRTKEAASLEVRKRAEAVEAELVRTEIELARATDPIGRESLARRRGYRMPQESPLVIGP